jgi:hypothetical protein
MSDLTHKGTPIEGTPIEGTPIKGNIDKAAALNAPFSQPTRGEKISVPESEPCSSALTITPLAAGSALSTATGRENAAALELWQIWLDHAPDWFVKPSKFPRYAEKVLRKFVRDYGEAAPDILRRALGYAATDSWCRDKRLTIANFLSNNKPEQYADRAEAAPPPSQEFEGNWLMSREEYYNLFDDTRTIEVTHG